ncbi:hypothetical protein T261_07876 [Streptomyces lydicus]|nr:hypothetical protein T261_07876 [Streptomyces lydicus]
MDRPTAAAVLRSSDADRHTHAAAYLRSLLAGCLGTAPDQVALDQPLEAQGFDSVTIAGISVIIEEDLGVRVPIAELAASGLGELARLLAAGVRTSEREAGEVGADAPVDRSR